MRRAGQFPELGDSSKIEIWIEPGGKGKLILSLLVLPVPRTQVGFDCAESGSLFDW